MNAPDSTTKWWFRQLRRLIVVGVLVGATGVALGPSLLTWFPQLRDLVLQQLGHGMNARVEVASFSMGWFQPVRVTGVRLVPPEGEPPLVIDRVETDLPLWRMVLTPDDLGTIRVERPTAFLHLRAGGSNFSDLFPIDTEQPNVTTAPRFIIAFGAKLRVIDGTFRCLSEKNNEPWAIARLNCGVGWRPASRSTSGQPELLVDRGKLLDHCDLSVGLCDDLLKFIAPVLAEVAKARGQITIDLDDWRIPWDDPGSGDLSGRLTMHTVDVSPGPLVTSLIAMIRGLPIAGGLTSGVQIPTEIELARESTVPFDMEAGGRIRHANLRFSAAGLIDVETHGTVGLDSTLDVRSTLGFHPPRPEERYLAILRVLTSQPWPLNIRGSLGKPVVDASPLDQAWRELLRNTAHDWATGNKSLGADALRALNNAGIPLQPAHIDMLLNLIPAAKTPPMDQGPAPLGATPPTVPSPPTPPPPAPLLNLPPSTSTLPANPQVQTTPMPPPPVDAPQPQSPVGEGVKIAVDVLDAIRAARQQPPQTMPPGAPPQPPPRRPLLRKRLQLLLEATAPPPQTPAQTVPPEPAPPTTTDGGSAPAPKNPK